MIELVYQNGHACVFSAADWATLRKDHRIIGNIEGGTKCLPTLPVILLHEEVSLLINKNIAKLVTYPNLRNGDVQKKLDIFMDIQKNLLAAQIVTYRKNRREDLERLIDKIIEGKIKKHPEVALKSREEILEEELDKSYVPSESTMIWPVLTEPLESIIGPSVDVPASEILNKTTATRCAIFADLWEKDFCLTAGSKFGGDFCVYVGDPYLYHAVYIIRCVENPNQRNHVTEIITFGRLANSVKKRGVYASVNAEGVVSYISLHWMNV